MNHEEYENALKDCYNKCSKELLSMIKDRAKFMYKLNTAEVIYTYRTDGKSSGMVEVSPNLSVIYEIDRNNNWLINQFVIAHELTHLYFLPTNLNGILGFCKSDDSYAFTAVMRRIDDKFYGKELEEKIADYIAIELVCKINPELSKGEVLSIVYSDKIMNIQHYNVISEFISLFGKPIEEIKYLDQLEKVNDSNYEIPNMLLYYISVSELHTFICEYDDIMGKISWKSIVDKLERYFFEGEGLVEIKTEFIRFKNIEEDK